MPFNYRRLLAGLALAAACPPSPVLAQAPTPARESASALPPRVYRLAAPLDAAAAARLDGAGVDVLHHYGRGRYLLSAPPPASLLAPPDPKAAAARAGAPAAAVSASDVYPDLAAAIRAGARERYEVEVVLAFPGAVDYLGGAFAKTGFTPTAPERPASRSVRGSVPAAAIPALLAHDYVLDVGAAMADAAILNDEARREHRVNVLHRGRAGLPGLDGAGVVVGVGDGGQLSGHPDVGGRVLYSTWWYNSGWGIHPDFVAGLIGGSGAVDERYRGTAPAASLVIENSSSITYYAEKHYREHGMTITNNSYGPYTTCETVGRYYYAAATLDEQAVTRPEVLHVFASGNSAGMSCDGGYAPPYHTIIPGGQTAKNTLTVGSAHSERLRYRSSSAGPTFDGRLKPELVAVGHNVVSNDRSRDYDGGSGTSFASPNAAGVLALLTQHYARLHDGRKPSGALLKAVACNSATDVGRAGPDFEHGFGLVNGLGGARVLSGGQHAESVLPTGGTAVHEIAVAPGRERLKALLYWHDRPGATTNEVPALVDDLDLALVTPAGDTLRPWVLDAREPAREARRGRDTVNNVEQVTLEAPAPGTYRLVVTSRRQDYGSTGYVVTWDAPAPEVTLTQPLGGESVDPDREIALAWEGSPGQTGTWHVEYARVRDGGAPLWRTLQRGVPTLTKSVVWPDPPRRGQFRFRVTNEATGLSDETDAAVTVLAPPAKLAAEAACGRSAVLSWAPPPGAAAYEVYRHDGADMVAIGKTAETAFAVSGLPEDGEALFSVAAVDEHGARGPRARGLFVARPAAEQPCSEPVPVTWRGVTARRDGGAAVVEWSVGAEFENDYFAVERGRASATGLTWTPLAEVRGRGTANTPADYRHEDAFVPPGEDVYYRVRQVDFDGTSELSPTVALAAARATAGEHAEAWVTLSRNRLDAGATVTLSGGVEAAEAELFDVAGRRVLAQDLGPGTSVLEGVGGLAAGAYVLRVTDGARTRGLRVVRP